MSAKLHGYAALTVVGQIGAGLGTMVLVELLQRDIPIHRFATPGAMAAIMWICAFCVPRQCHDNYRSGVEIHRRMLGGLLVGSSLAAALWPILGLGHAGWLLLTGMCARWYLFGAETIRLHHEDRMKQPRPSAATQSRRAITLITGVLIPLLLLAGAPPLPWLWISFLLTIFCQWTIVGERFHAFCPPPELHAFSGKT